MNREDKETILVAVIVIPLVIGLIVFSVMAFGSLAVKIFGPF